MPTNATSSSSGRSAAQALNCFWLAVASPWLAFALRDLLHELQEPGYAVDPPNHVGAFVAFRFLIPGWLVCLGALLALTIYVWWTGSPGSRRRIAIWSAVAIGYISLEPGPVYCKSLVLYDAVDAAWLGCLVVPPIVWLFRDPAPRSST